MTIGMHGMVVVVAATDTTCAACGGHVAAGEVVIRHVGRVRPAPMTMHADVHGVCACIPPSRPQSSDADGGGDAEIVG